MYVLRIKVVKTGKVYIERCNNITEVVAKSKDIYANGYKAPDNTIYKQYQVVPICPELVNRTMKTT